MQCGGGAQNAPPFTADPKKENKNKPRCETTSDYGRGDSPGDEIGRAVLATSSGFITMFPQQKCVRYDRSIVLVAQQQFRMISALLKEKTEGVFHLVSERGGKKKVVWKKGGLFFLFSSQKNWKRSEGGLSRSLLSCEGQTGVKSLFPGGWSVCLLCIHKRGRGRGGFHTTH